MIDERDVRQEIIATLTQVSDHTLKAVLLLMLQMAEQNVEHMTALSRKIDQILSDESRIKEVVLNGHSEIHDEHHRWIAERIRHSGHCVWAQQKIEAEREAAQDRRGLRKAVLEKIVIALLAGLLGLMAPQITGLLK